LGICIINIFIVVTIKKKFPIGDVLMLLFLHSGEGITLKYITRMGVKKERKKMNERKKERNPNILILT
jgi:hypothetical protein